MRHASIPPSLHHLLTNISSTELLTGRGDSAAIIPFHNIISIPDSELTGNVEAFSTPLPKKITPPSRGPNYRVLQGNWAE